MAMPRSSSDVHELRKLISARYSNHLCDEELLARFVLRQSNLENAYVLLSSFGHTRSGHITELFLSPQYSRRIC
jgi:hypothetical protein